MQGGRLPVSEIVSKAEEADGESGGFRHLEALGRPYESLGKMFLFPPPDPDVWFVQVDLVLPFCLSLFAESIPLGIELDKPG